MDVEERREQLREAVGVLDDHRPGRPRGFGIGVAGGEPSEEELGVTSYERDGRLHVMPSHLEDVFTEPLEVALSGDVVKDDDAALQTTLRRAEHRRIEAQDTTLLGAQLDLDALDARARAEAIDDGNDGDGDLLRRLRPLREALPFQRTAQHEARAIQIEELARRPVQPHDRAAGVDDQKGVVDAREHGFQLQRVPLVL